MAGLCTLLFGGGMTTPAYITPALARMMQLVKDRSVIDALAVDRLKISGDLQRAQVALANEQAKEAA